ncbi:MAG TPA: T9SS type A sorting domain-containing protein [Bacteroidia bacterium]
MTNLKRVCRVGLTFILLTLVKNSFSQTISPGVFGQNAWMPDTIGNVNNCTDPPCIFNGKLYQQWGNIKRSGATMIRYGGTAVDKNIPTNYQYVRMIDSIRANGMEPIIQVPFYNHRYTAQQAAAIVQYINITKGKNIKYWVIGNEPNLGYSYTTASQVAAYIKPFASAMKAIDPTIKIIGPELAWFDQNIINGLTTPNGADDITGADQNGRYYIDVFSLHTYPFNGSQTRTQVISKLTAPGSFQDNLVYLNGRIATCNTAHNRSGLNAIKTAVDEMNIDWQNSTSDDLYGLGANSFIGGQFVAELMGLGMKNSVSYMNVWSVVEGGGANTNIGYIDPQTGNKKPSYYHFQMVADNMKGTYANGTSNVANVKAYGSYNSQQIAVLIMNEDQGNNYNYTVRLNTAAATGNNPLKININANVAAEYNGTIQNQSSIVLVFNAAGQIVKKYEYSLSTNAVANIGPTVTDYTTTGGVSHNSQAHGVFEMNIYPNPSFGKLTIALNRGDSQEKNFRVQIFNLIGQEVLDKKSDFNNNDREEIELSPAMANGVYILRIKEGERDHYITKKFILARP